MITPFNLANIIQYFILGYNPDDSGVDLGDSGFDGYTDEPAPVTSENSNEDIYPDIDTPLAGGTLEAPLTYQSDLDEICSVEHITQKARFASTCDEIFLTHKCAIKLYEENGVPDSIGGTNEFFAGITVIYSDKSFIELLKKSVQESGCDSVYSPQELENDILALQNYGNDYFENLLKNDKIPDQDRESIETVLSNLDEFLRESKKNQPQQNNNKINNNVPSPTDLISKQIPISDESFDQICLPIKYQIIDLGPASKLNRDNLDLSSNHEIYRGSTGLTSLTLQLGWEFMLELANSLENIDEPLNWPFDNINASGILEDLNTLLESHPEFQESLIDDNDATCDLEDRFFLLVYSHGSQHTLIPFRGSQALERIRAQGIQGLYPEGPKLPYWLSLYAQSGTSIHDNPFMMKDYYSPRYSDRMLFQENQKTSPITKEELDSYDLLTFDLNDLYQKRAYYCHEYTGAYYQAQISLGMPPDLEVPASLWERYWDERLTSMRHSCNESELRKNKILHEILTCSAKVNELTYEELKATYESEIYDLTFGNSLRPASDFINKSDTMTYLRDFFTTTCVIKKAIINTMKEAALNSSAKIDLADDWELPKIDREKPPRIIKYTDEVTVTTSGRIIPQVERNPLYLGPDVREEIPEYKIFNISSNNDEVSINELAQFDKGQLQDLHKCNLNGIQSKTHFDQDLQSAYEKELANNRELNQSTLHAIAFSSFTYDSSYVDLVILKGGFNVYCANGIMYEDIDSVLDWFERNDELLFRPYPYLEFSRNKNLEADNLPDTSDFNFISQLDESFIEVISSGEASEIWIELQNLHEVGYENIFGKFSQEMNAFGYDFGQRVTNLSVPNSKLSEESQEAKKRLSSCSNLALGAYHGYYDSYVQNYPFDEDDNEQLALMMSNKILYQDCLLDNLYEEEIATCEDESESEDLPKNLSPCLINKGRKIAYQKIIEDYEMYLFKKGMVIVEPTSTP